MVAPYGNFSSIYTIQTKEMQLIQETHQIIKDRNLGRECPNNDAYSLLPNCLMTSLHWSVLGIVRRPDEIYFIGPFEVYGYHTTKDALRGEIYFKLLSEFKDKFQFNATIFSAFLVPSFFVTLEDVYPNRLDEFKKSDWMNEKKVYIWQNPKIL